MNFRQSRIGSDMTSTAKAMALPQGLDVFPDLEAVPKHRRLLRNDYIERFRKALPFDYIAISGLNLEQYRFGRFGSIDTDMPASFIKDYTSSGVSAVDPFLHAATASASATIIEGDVYARTPPPERVRRLTAFHGVLNRTLIPIARNGRIYGAVCVSRSTPFNENEIAYLRAMAMPVHTHITKPLMDRFAVRHLRLSKGEIACLRQASHGLTSQAISLITGYQNDTVNSYLKSAISKLGADNRTQAIADAIRMGIIE
jgi:LuxR family transcriptional regulator